MVALHVLVGMPLTLPAGRIFPSCFGVSFCCFVVFVVLLHFTLYRTCMLFFYLRLVLVVQYCEAFRDSKRTCAATSDILFVTPFSLESAGGRGGTSRHPGEKRT